MAPIVNALFTSIFFFGCLLASLFYDRWVDATVLRQGASLKISKKIFVLLIACGAIAGALLAAFFTYISGPQALQYFYIALYTFAGIIGFLFLLRIKTFWVRLYLSTTIMFGALAFLLQHPNQFLQNTFMALSIIWVGALLFRILKITKPVFQVFLVAVMAIDIVNILFFEIQTFSDASFFLNGLISFGSSTLGIGDFFLGYLIIAASRRYAGSRVSIIFTFILALPIALRRIIAPELNGVIIPYYGVMVPLTLFVWWIVGIRKESKNPDIVKI